MKTRLVVILVAMAAVCGATTIIPMSVEDLARASTHIAEARVLDTWSAWNPQHTLIYTYSHVQVVRTLKGNNTGTFVVKQVGGSAGGYTQKVAGVRQLIPGEDTLLFLRSSQVGDGTLVVVGLMQGNFRIYSASSGRVMVSNGIPAVSAVQRGQIASFTGAAMPLDQMEARIRKAMQ